MSSSTSSSDEKDIVIYYWYKRNYLVHHYTDKNINCWTIVPARELQGTDAQFLAFYRMLRESYNELVKINFSCHSFAKHSHKRM